MKRYNQYGFADAGFMTPANPIIKLILVKVWLEIDIHIIGINRRYFRSSYMELIISARQICIQILRIVGAAGFIFWNRSIFIYGISWIWFSGYIFETEGVPFQRWGILFIECKFKVCGTGYNVFWHGGMCFDLDCIVKFYFTTSIGNIIWWSFI